MQLRLFIIPSDSDLDPSEAWRVDSRRGLKLKRGREKDINGSRSEW